MKYKVTLNGRTYEVEVDTDKAMLVDEYEAYAPAPVPAAPAPVTAAVPAPVTAAVPAPAPVAGTAVTAPMPGNILKVLVTPGQQVREGEAIMVLEAMKMENEIVAPKDGSVAQVLVTKGTVVETGTTLAVIA